jgi:hypothetical protein
MMAILDLKVSSAGQEHRRRLKKPLSEPFWAVSEQTTSESSQDTTFGNLAELWVGEHCVD